jgi:hypothetical protein
VPFGVPRASWGSGLRSARSGARRFDAVRTSPKPQPRRPRRVGEDRIVCLPNVVTTTRLVLVPVFVWLLLQPHHRDWFQAAILLVALGSTDWVDGQLARRLDQVTTAARCSIRPPTGFYSQPPLSVSSLSAPYRFPSR